MTVRVGWAVGSVLTSTLIFITGTLFLRFLTDYVGLAAGLAAGLLALPKLFDIVIYPLMGVVSDHARSRFGRRRPFLLAGALLGGLSLVMMFNVPAEFGVGAKSAYVLCALVLGSIANASFNVPYLAMPAEMTSSPIERNVLISYRVYILSGSQVVAGGVCPLLVQAFGGGASAYGAMAMVMAAYLVVVGYICFTATGKAPSTTLSVTHKNEFWKALPSIFKSRNLLALLLCKYTFLVGSTVHTATAAFYVRYVMGAADSVLSLFLVTYSVGMVASQPLWLVVAKRLGKARCFTVAAMVYASVSVTWSLLHPNNAQILFLVLSAANGMGAGGILLMSQSMLPDVIDDDYALRGIRREGSVVSVFALAEKASLASGLAVVGVVLSWFHYTAPKAGAALDPVAQQGVVVAFGLTPALFVGLSAAWLLLRVRPKAAAPASRPIAAGTEA